MAADYKNVMALRNEAAKCREAQINEIISRGGVVKFTNTLNGVVKFVNNADKDDDGDLTAFKHTGRSSAVCWEAVEYTVTEATPEEYA